MTDRPSIDTSGINKALRGMRLGAPAMQRRVLKRSGLAIMAEAGQLGVIPRKTGKLAGSDFINEPRGGTVTIGYNEDYAAVVHERHPTRAQWFLNTINTHFKRILKAEAKAALDENARKNGGGK